MKELLDRLYYALCIPLKSKAELELHDKVNVLIEKAQEELQKKKKN